MPEDKSQKTEKPTERRRREARREGQIAKSQDLHPWITVLAATFVVPPLLSAIGRRLAATFADLQRVVLHPESAVMLEVSGSVALSVLLVLAGFMVSVMVLSIVNNLAQVGFVASGKPLKPQVKRISPIAGFKRLFSVRTAWQGLTGVLKMVAVGLVAIPMLVGVSRDLLGALQFDLSAAISHVGHSTLAVVRITAVAGLLIAVADFAFQRWKTQRDMMMTRYELKRELRNTEGDPHIKARRHALRLAASRNRMIAAVGDADVVVVNPAHVAVALRYRPETGAPRVLARGADTVALRIKQQARAAGVPVVEAKLLARALYATCDVGEEIPRELFEGVAVVLAFVHRLAGRPALSGDHLLDVSVTWDPALSEDTGMRRGAPRRRRRSRSEPHVGAPVADTARR